MSKYSEFEQTKNAREYFDEDFSSSSDGRRYSYSEEILRIIIQLDAKRTRAFHLKREVMAAVPELAEDTVRMIRGYTQ